MFLVGAPFIFWASWKVIELFLDKRTAAKIAFVKAAAVADNLSSYTEMNKIPAYFGGSKSPARTAHSQLRSTFFFSRPQPLPELFFLAMEGDYPCPNIPGEPNYGDPGFPQGDSPPPEPAQSSDVVEPEASPEASAPVVKHVTDL